MNRPRHNWDSTKTACLKCDMQYQIFREMLDDLKQMEKDHEDTTDIQYQLRCLK
jgi:hypothetical protein